MFTCGDGSHGQLGLPQDRLPLGYVTAFAQVPALTECRINKVFAGGRSSFAVTGAGVVFAWGHKYVTVERNA